MKRSLLSLVLAVLSFFGSAPVYSDAPNQPVLAAPKQPAYVPTAEQIRAIQTLFSYSLMANNPIVAEREFEIKQAKERIRKLSEKRNDELKPLEQIQLMQDTFILTAFDGFLAKTTLAIGISFATVAFMEFLSRSYCRNNNLVEKIPGVKLEFSTSLDGDNVGEPGVGGCSVDKLGASKKDQGRAWFDVSASSMVKKDASTNYIEKAKYLFKGHVDELASYYYSKQVKALLDTFSFVRPFGYKQAIEEWEKNEVNAFAEILRQARRDVVTSLRGNSCDDGIPEGAYVKEVFNGGNRFPWLDRTMVVAKWFLVAAPFLKTAWRYVQKERATSLGKAPKNLLDDMLKQLNSRVTDSCSKESNYTFLLKFFIEPLWQKHGRNAEKVYSELAHMGERIRVREVGVVGGDKASVHRLVMGIHGSGILGVAPGRVGLVTKAFEHEFLKRMLYSAAVGSTAAFAHIAWCFARELFPWDALKEMSSSQVMLWTAVGMCSALSVKACVAGFWNRDSRRARVDYQIFLKSLLLGDSPHKGVFYWAWFLPMWRTNDRDLGKLEQLFIERSMEIEKSYNQLAAINLLSTLEKK